MRVGIALLMGASFIAPLFIVHAAKAQPVTGFYLSGGVGENFLRNQRVKSIYADGVSAPGAAHIMYNNGFTGEASFGYGFGDGVRVEVEGSFASNQNAKVGYADTQAYASGQQRKWGIFTNALYDFNVGLPYLYPYLGAGVGWQDENLNNFSSGGVTGNKTKATLAYQGIAGIAVPIPNNPNLSVTLEYRYVALIGAGKVNGSFGGIPVVAKVQGESNNEFLLGVRYAFGTAPAPVPAPAPEAAAPESAPAPQPARTYLVFFDWDSAALTSRATEIISHAAADSRTQQVTTINVSGYTDTSGTPTYNQGLSERRAKSVASQLESDGVSQSEIEVHAYGETHLLVQTGPGVREPQNRRVEIVLD